MAQNAAEQMRAATSGLLDDPGRAAEVDLELFARGALHPPERQIHADTQPSREALDRLIASSEGVVGNKVLVDPLEREPLVQPRLDLGAVRLTVTAAPRRAEGRNGWFCLSFARGPGGRNGRFCPQITTHGLPMHTQLPGYPTGGPAAFR